MRPEYDFSKGVRGKYYRPGWSGVRVAACCIWFFGGLFVGWGLNMLVHWLGWL